MKPQLKYPLLLGAVICCLSMHGQSLEQGFAHPPLSARPKVYWWWLNGNVNNQRLKEELREMKKAGLGGVEIFDIGMKEGENPGNMIPAGPAFMGDASLASMKVAIEEAGRLGFEVDLNLSSSWNAGGSWVRPAMAAKTLYFSKFAVHGGARQKLKLPFAEITRDKKGGVRQIQYTAEGKPVFYREVAVLALPAGSTRLDTSQVINVSAHFDEHTELLDWDAPAGEWEIYRYVCSNSGEQLVLPSGNSRGPIIDHFDPAATAEHVLYFINKLRPVIGDFRHSALRSFYLASYEAAEFTWTTGLPAAFRKLNGYDLYKFLPSIFNKELFAPAVMEAFQSDYRKTLSDLMIRNHYGKAREVCHQYGLTLISESGGPGGIHSIPVETLKALGVLDIPRGEFWNRYEVHDKGDSIDVKLLVKEIAAASHIYKRGLVEQEAFTSYQHWQEGPQDLKPLADRAFCEGMNRVVIHGFSHEPTGKRFPGAAFFAGTHFDDRNTWWPKIRPFNEYLGRVSYMLQHSAFVSDVLYYNGDGVPNLVPPKNTRFRVGPGYDYEVINTDVLLSSLTVEQGELVLPGVARYKLLYVEKGAKLNAPVMGKLDKLAAAGAVIIRSGASPAKALEDMHVPADISSDDGLAGLDYIHYRTADQDLYLLRNTTGQWLSKYCYFRQQQRSPSIWDPMTGGITGVTVYKQEGQLEKMLLTLAPYECYFVVFKKQGGAVQNGEIAREDGEIAREDGQAPLVQYVKGGYCFLDKGTSISLPGPWQVTFPEGRGAPESVEFSKLLSWTEAADPGINYFSGTARYTSGFTFSRAVAGDERVCLDLGTIKEVGEVWLNGKALGISWAMPHRIDITETVKQGQNLLKVEVANTWLNRLIGDDRTDTKFAITNLSKGNANLLLNDHIIPNNVVVPWKELKLSESGLIGPVMIRVIKVVRTN
jgi:hypothetical protein